MRVDQWPEQIKQRREFDMELSRMFKSHRAGCSAVFELIFHVKPHQHQNLTWYFCDGDTKARRFLMFPHFPKLRVALLFNMMYGNVTSLYRSTDGCAWWEARCASGRFFFYTLKRLFFLCILQLFRKTGQYQIYLPHFPLGALDEDIVLCNRCEGGREGGRFAQQSFPGTVSIRWCLTTDRLRSQAPQDGNNLCFFFFSFSRLWASPAHNEYNRSFASSRPCEVTNEATPSHQQITHDTLTHTFLARLS